MLSLRPMNTAYLPLEVNLAPRNYSAYLLVLIVSLVNSGPENLRLPRLTPLPLLPLVESPNHSSEAVLLVEWTSLDNGTRCPSSFKSGQWVEVELSGDLHLPNPQCLCQVRDCEPTLFKYVTGNKERVSSRRGIPKWLANVSSYPPNVSGESHSTASILLI